MTCPSGNSEFCFPSTSMFPSASPRGTLRVSGKQNSLFPLEPVIKCLMYARPCSIKWRVQFQFSCKIFVAFSASSFCLSFGNVKIIMNNQNVTSSLWLLPSKDVHLNVSVFTLFIYIFIEYFWLCLLALHSLKLIEEANFPLIILKPRFSVFVQRIFNWLWRFRILITLLSFADVHRENFVVKHK